MRWLGRQSKTKEQMASVADSALTVIRDVIRGMGLRYNLSTDASSGVALENVEIVERAVPFDKNLPPHKGITITAVQEHESVDVREGVRLPGGTNNRDDIGHPFLITIAHGTGKGSTEGTAFINHARERIRRTFNHQRLTPHGFSVSGVDDCGCTVQTRDTDLRDMEKWQANWNVSQLVVTFWAREPRE